MQEGLLEIGAVMLSRSQRRLEATMANIANMTTPGFKRQRIAETFVVALAGLTAVSSTKADFSQGMLKSAAGPLNLGISGQGFFKVRNSEGEVFFSRGGQFSRSSNGRVVDAHGMTLQTIEGRDLVLGSVDIEIVENGTVLEHGRPVARIGLFAPASTSQMRTYAGSLFQKDEADMFEVNSPLIRQGTLEGSNVDVSFEMTEVMSAMRQAETGSRVVQTFDTLIGQAISTFGRSGR